VAGAQEAVRTEAKVGFLLQKNPDTEDPGGDDLVAVGTVIRVLQIIRGLPEAYRETLLLRLVEGLSGPEIASATGLTEAVMWHTTIPEPSSLLALGMAVPGLALILRRRSD
jgi:DNA-directed RNA polymerase specialized sigma24 family protein